MSESALPIRWTPQEIVLALRARGWTNRKIAAMVQLAASSIPYALATGSSAALREFCSKVVGEPQEVLWPSRFPPQWAVTAGSHSRFATSPEPLKPTQLQGDDPGRDRD